MARKRQGSFDLFEGFMTVLGILFLGLSGLCLFATIYLIITFGDRDPAFTGSLAFLQVIKGVGIGLFGVGTVVMFGVSAHLLGDRTRSRWRTLFRRRQ